MMRKQKEGLNHSEVNPEPVQTVRCCSAVLVLCIFPETLFNMEKFIHLIIDMVERQETEVPVKKGNDKEGPWRKEHRQGNHDHLKQ